MEDLRVAAIPASRPSIKGKVYFPSLRRASSREDCCPSLLILVEWQTIRFCPKGALCLESPLTCQASPGDPWPCRCIQPNSALGARLQENGGSSNKSRSKVAVAVGPVFWMSDTTWAQMPLWWWWELLSHWKKAQVEFRILCACFVIIYGVLWVDFY